MRAVVDTNVLVSGLLWHGTPHVLLQQVRDGTLKLVSSAALLAELDEVLCRVHLAAIMERANISRELSLTRLRQLAELIEPLPLPKPVCRDPDDDGILALAITAKVELIISGDADLLILRHYEGIDIVTPSEALRRIMNAP